jgi:hypothetical protein
MRPSTLLILAGVTLLGLFAAVDALRGTSTSSSSSPPAGEEQARIELQPVADEPAIEGRGELERTLRAAGVAGTLFITDEGCRLRALSLPSLNWLLDSGAERDECEFTVAPDSRHVVRFGGGVAWSPNGRTSASCGQNSVVVHGRTGQQLYEVIGYCAPAWKPDGTFTLARGGTFVVFRPPCQEGQRVCEHVILSKTDLEPALRSGRTQLRSLYAPVIRQAIWLSNSRVALVIGTRVRAQPGASTDLLAIFEGRRLVGEPLVNSRFDELAVSPARRYLAIHGSSFRGLSFVDSESRLLARNPLASGHHAAWSPDERWTAVATGGSTYLFRTAELAFFNSDSRPRAIQIPVHAADLEWR